MESRFEKPTYKHDAFISYSRKDKEFAKKLEKALEDYKPPKDLKVPQRNLDIFRDEEDFTGVEYHESLAKCLKESAKLIVLCSPNSRKSEFVNEEIRQFAEIKGSRNIIPVLVSGIPNNDAKVGQEDEMAFPQALCKLMEMPLAADYRGFDLKKDKANKGSFAGSWHKLLADIYGISRGEIEQREKKREARTRRIRRGIVSGVITVLLVALVVTLFFWRNAVEQRKEAERRRFISIAQSLSTQALVQKDKGGQDERAALLTRQAYRFNKRYKGHALAQIDNALRTVLSANDFRRILGLHEGSVNSVAFSLDGKFLASGGGDKTVRLWDLSEQNPESKVLGLHEGSVNSVAFSLDGKFLASGGDDKTVRRWDLSERNSESKVLGVHEGSVNSVAFSLDGKFLASGSWGDVDVRNILLWDLTKPNPEPKVLRGHKRGVNSVAFSPDGSKMASGGFDDASYPLGRVLTWDLSKPNPEPKVLSIHELRSVNSVAFNPVENKLAVGVNDMEYDPMHGVKIDKGDDDETLLLWDLSKLNPEFKALFGHRNFVYSVAFSPDGNRLAVGGDGTIHIWDLTSPSAESILLSGHVGKVNSVAFSHDGKTLASGGIDNTIIIWNLETETLADLVCKSVDRNLTLNEWHQFVGTDIPYDLTCLPIRLSFIEAVRNLARDGNMDDAIAIFRKAKELNSTLELDPETEAKKLAAPVLVVKGEELARDGNVEGTIESFRKAKELDPTLELDPETAAKKLAAGALVDKGEDSARDGNIESAIESFRKAKELDPTLELDPETEAKKLAAGALVDKGENSARDGDVEGAIKSFRKVKELDPTLELDPETAAKKLAAPVLVVKGEELARDGNVEGTIESFRKAKELDPTLELDPETAAKKLAAGALVDKGEDSARDGNIESAIESFRKAKELDPTLELDPETEAKKLAVQVLVGKGENSARDGDVEGAIKSFRKVKELDPTLELDPETKAKEIAAQGLVYTVEGLVRKGEKLARDGYIESAIESFRKAKELDPTLELDPETAAKKLVAPVLVVKGEQLVRQGKVEEAISAYEEAQALDPNLKISASSWDDLCAFGSLWERADGVMNACEKAVALEPENGLYREGRGLARALTGDTEGAIDDFEAYINWTKFEKKKSQRQRWIKALQAGRNPFTPAELERLRNE